MVVLLCVYFLNSCTGIPQGIQPVNNFNLQQYLGQWYEIARLDHSFERGMQSVSATYEMRQDGGVRVLNKGLMVNENAWNQVEGKAYFVDEQEVAHLKVSFFGPFYGSYIVFELDENYDYSFVTSSNKSYLWLLSRRPEIEESLRQRFINTATALGYDTDELIWVDHGGKKDFFSLTSSYMN